MRRRAPLEVHGVKLPREALDLSPAIARAISRGRYERHEVELMRAILVQGDRLLEIGGGLGVVSAAAALTGKPAAIHTYEAHPDMPALIAKTHAANDLSGRVEVTHGAVVGDGAPAEVTFNVRRAFWASSTRSPPKGRRSRVVSVKAFPINDLVARHKPTVISMDVEGSELDILPGATLEGVRHVVMELHQNVTGGRGVKAVFDAMSAADFHYDPKFSEGAVVTFTRVQD
ncbi:MAG: FkbM family methyltransferase [Pseudomonadota bacterium]